MYKKFKQLIFRLLLPLIKYYKLLSWNLYLLTSKNIKIIVGAGTTKFKGWFTTDIHYLNITEESDFKKYFSNKRIDNILAEHVLEHLENDELELMADNFYKYSSNKINIRIAVPDGYHKSKDYINMVKPGGTGAGADEHKNLFNYKSLSRLFEKHNFTPYLIEYWDENGVFHNNNLDIDNGFIERSFKNDPRNKNGEPIYTSLIIDFKKK